MNQTTPSPYHHLNSTEALETRVAVRLVAALTEHQLDATSPDIDARLSFAREQAMATARKTQRVTAPSILGSVGGAAVLGGGPSGDELGMALQGRWPRMLNAGL